MKILMVIPGLDRKLGGTTTASLGFYEHLKVFVDVEIATVYMNEEERNSYDSELLDDPKIHCFPSSFSFYKFSFGLRSFLLENVKNYDIIHIHALWHGASYPAAKIAMDNGVPYIISPHGMLEEDAFARSGLKKSVFWNLLYKKVFKSAAAIHCIADSEIKNTKNFDKNGNIFYVPNGIYLPQINPREKEKTLLYIGRLHEKKAVEKIIETMPFFPDWKLKIAGTGADGYTAMLKKLVIELHLTNQIEFVGFVEGDKKNELFQESMFALVPSYSEGLPLTALESLANGTPLLITKASNVPEVTEYKCGLELDNNTIESIRIGLEELMKEDYSVLSQNARSLAESKFHWPKTAKQLYENYKIVLDED